MDEQNRQQRSLSSAKRLERQAKRAKAQASRQKPSVVTGFLDGRYLVEGLGQESVPKTATTNGAIAIGQSVRAHGGAIDSMPRVAPVLPEEPARRKSGQIKYAFITQDDDGITKLCVAGWKIGAFDVAKELQIPYLMRCKIDNLGGDSYRITLFITDPTGNYVELIENGNSLWTVPVPPSFPDMLANAVIIGHGFVVMPFFGDPSTSGSFITGDSSSSESFTPCRQTSGSGWSRSVGTGRVGAYFYDGTVTTISHSDRTRSSASRSSTTSYVLGFDEESGGVICSPEFATSSLTVAEVDQFLAIVKPGITTPAGYTVQQSTFVTGGNATVSGFNTTRTVDPMRFNADLNIGIGIERVYDTPTVNGFGQGGSDDFYFYVFEEDLDKTHYKSAIPSTVFHPPWTETGEGFLGTGAGWEADIQKETLSQFWGFWWNNYVVWDENQLPLIYVPAIRKEPVEQEVKLYDFKFNPQDSISVTIHPPGYSGPVTIGPNFNLLSSSYSAG